jgi:predicted RNase H-like HicB family nuclease
MTAWPARFFFDTDGRIQVRFPDFAEAMTDGADEEEAMLEAADCLAEAIASRIADREAVPPPSPLEPGMLMVRPAP